MIKASASSKRIIMRFILRIRQALTTAETLAVIRNSTAELSISESLWRERLAPEKFGILLAPTF